MAKKRIPKISVLIGHRARSHRCERVRLDKREKDKAKKSKRGWWVYIE